LTKEPWKEFPHIWKTKAKFLAWLRGGIRRACWNRSPIKHEVIKNNRKRVLNESTGNMVWGGECYLCGKDFLQKDLQVDHINGENTLTEIGDIQSFVESMTCLSSDDLALVCKPCHSVKSYSEKQGITFEQAVIEKRIIELTKLPVKELQELLAKHNKPSNNASVRKQSVRELVEEGKI
jgi:5-methylcytosine-specific restriction endonuclease McrA